MIFGFSTYYEFDMKWRRIKKYLMNIKAMIRLLSEAAKLDLEMVDKKWTYVLLPCALHQNDSP